MNLNTADDSTFKLVFQAPSNFCCCLHATALSFLILFAMYKQSFTSSSSQNHHRLVWVGRDLPAPLPRAQTPPTRPGCSKPLVSNLNFPSHSLKPFPLVLSPHALVKSPPRALF